MNADEHTLQRHFAETRARFAQTDPNAYGLETFAIDLVDHADGIVILGVLVRDPRPAALVTNLERE